jgi:hypothetical protein
VEHEAPFSKEALEENVPQPPARPHRQRSGTPGFQLADVEEVARV